MKNSKLEKPITCTLVIPFGLREKILKEAQEKGSNFSSVIRELLYKNYKYGRKIKSSK